MKVQVPKENTYIPDLLLKVFSKKATSAGTVDRRIGLDSGDPRMIAPNIAPIPPPSVQSLVQEHQTRY